MDSRTQLFDQIKTLIKLALLFLIGLLIEGVCGRPPDLVVRNHITSCLAGKSAAYFYAKGGYVCCSCDVGEHWIEDCIQNEPNSTECALCVHNGTLNIFTFTSEANSYPTCNISKSESDCEKLMLTEFQIGNSTANGRCICVDGSFSKNPDKSGCTLFQECPKGFEPTFYGNSTDNVRCGRCLNGMCSYISSSTEKCVPCAEDVTDLDNDSTTMAPAATNPHNADFPTAYIVLIIIGGLLLIGVIIITLLYKKGLFRQCCDATQDKTDTNDNINNGNHTSSHRNGQPHLDRGDANHPHEMVPMLPNGTTNGGSVGVTAFVDDNVENHECEESVERVIREDPPARAEQLPRESDDQQPHTSEVPTSASPAPNTRGDSANENEDESGEEQDEQPPSGMPTTPHQSSSNGSTHGTPPASEAGSGTDAQELSDIEQRLRKDLDVFRVEEQNTLREMNMPHALHDALYSQDYLDEMCRKWYLEVSLSDLKEFLRRYKLLKDIRIDEIPNEKGSNSSETKWQYLYEMQQEQGENLNPKVLFEKILDFKKLQFYDDLFKYFVEILKSNNPIQNNS